MEVCRKFDVEKYKIVSFKVNFCICVCVCVSGTYNMAIYQTFKNKFRNVWFIDYSALWFLCVGVYLLLVYFPGC